MIILEPYIQAPQYYERHLLFALDVTVLPYRPNDVGRLIQMDIAGAYLSKTVVYDRVTTIY